MWTPYRPRYWSGPTRAELLTQRRERLARLSRNRWAR